MNTAVTILDNGAYLAKVGLSTDPPESVKLVPNCIMKAKSERRRPFIGLQIDDCRDMAGLYYILPFQKGYILNWDIQKTVWDYIFSKECCPVNMNQSSIIVTEPLFNFPSIQEAITEIFFEEYEVNSLLRINASALSCYNYSSKNPQAKCCIIVDCGYSFCHIIPYIDHVKIKAGVRRIDVGGKLLTNHLKEIISYRQINVMDETHVVNQVKEDSCYVSLDFYKDMKKAKEKLEKNEIVKDYILPDFTTLRRGYLTDIGPEETSQYQRIRLCNERFSIPEILFHPSDIGIKQMGIPEAIMDCLKACAEETWPHLLDNIVLTGGSTNFPGFKERLYHEMRCLAPVDYNVKVISSQSPIEFAYNGGHLLSKDAELANLMVKKEDYEEHGYNLCFEKFDV